MATLDECTSAVEDLASRLALVDPEIMRRHAVDRSITCHINDLGVDYSAELEGGRLTEVRLEPNPRAQVKVRVSSDDLVALSRGEMHAGHAWATGRLRVSAPLRDLLRLRSFI